MHFRQYVDVVDRCIGSVLRSIRDKQRNSVVLPMPFGPMIATFSPASIDRSTPSKSGTGHGFSGPKNKDEERANAQSIGTTARTLKELFGI